MKSGIGTRDEGAFEPGDLVWVNYDGLLYEARIINEFKVGRFGVAFDRYGYSKTGAVELKDLRKYEAVVEGDRVDAEIHGNNGPEYFQGVVMNVHPDGQFSILYDDGEFSVGVEPDDVQPIAE